MDIREEIIQKVIQALEGRVDAKTVDTVQDVLIMQLNSYEIQERCTDITIVDDSAEKMLKSFWQRNGLKVLRNLHCIDMQRKIGN